MGEKVPGSIHPDWTRPAKVAMRGLNPSREQSGASHDLVDILLNRMNALLTGFIYQAIDSRIGACPLSDHGDSWGIRSGWKPDWNRGGARWVWRLWLPAAALDPPL